MRPSIISAARGPHAPLGLDSKCCALYVLSGRVRFHVDGEVLEPPVGRALTIVPGSVHRIEAVDDVVLFEVSTAHPEDVVRLDDRYGRISQCQEGSGEGDPHAPVCIYDPIATSSVTACPAAGCEALR